MGLKERFIKQYSMCIDTNGSTINCGREQCMKLIELAQEIDKHEDNYYGNVNIGFMNIEHIRELYKKVIKKCNL